MAAKPENLSNNGASASRWRTLGRWLQPGLGVKRWLLVMVLGTALIGLGLAVLLLDLYRANPESPLLAFLSLRALPRALRAALLASAGLGMLYLAVFRLNRTLLAPYMRKGKAVVDAVAEHRRLGRGPKVVAIGGGTGLSTLLRGMKTRTGNLTAVVTVADDGGSSGRLRRSLGLPPPGDVRNCLAALSDDEDLLTQLFQYRFPGGDELEGHSFGNLFIAALAGVTGSFDRGVLEAGRVLAIQGRVLPATLSDVALVADKAHEIDSQAFRIEGESQIPSVPGRVRRVHLEPNNAPAYPEAIRALLNADLIVLGPGSLYTSLLPNLLVPELADAIRASRAFKVYVCNLATQAGETDGYDCAQHLAALEEHAGRGLVDLMLVGECPAGGLPQGTQPVALKGNGLNVPMAAEDLADPLRPGHHDPAKLADTLLRLLEERTGPLDLPPLEASGSSSSPN
ncbi:MAG TPA: gluconeogenesis factor YvcK family protein [Anaerolineales bacterium]|nr:gluconeogenesis factor YvcK family protein [Anaerolineales bacterium]